MTDPSFDLIDEPWIVAHTLAGEEVTLSLRETFARLHTLSTLAGELPTQVFAINRLLLAIMYRAVDPLQVQWQEMWSTHSLPLEMIDHYLEQHRSRFDLLHPSTPFFQVADLHTAKGTFSPVARLIGDAPSLDRPHFSTRWAEGLATLSFAEAARWLVHVHAFDVSGIKSGAVGDPRVKGGRGYPIGMGAAGHLGGMLLEGDDALQTLLLNLVEQEEVEFEEDLPPWEREPDGPAPAYVEVDDRPHRPAGRAELFTWQTRRVRLVHDGTQVTRVLLCNGDRFSPVQLQKIETMTAWRDSPTQAKKLGLGEAKMPRLHEPGRQLWRGLTSLLAETDEGGDLGLATLEWAGRQTAQKVIDETAVMQVHALGMEYVNQSSNTGDVIDDVLSIPTRIVHHERADLRVVVRDAVERTDQAVFALAQLAVNLARAAGDDTDAAELRSQAQGEAFALLDRPFQQWLLSLRDPAVEGPAAQETWFTHLRRTVLKLAETWVESAGPAAWIGRTVGEQTITAARAELWFRNKLFSILPPTRQESA